MNKKYTEGIGRRKTSTARVRVYEGKQPSTVNGKTIGEFFSSPEASQLINMPLTVVELDKKYYFTAKVSGGGMTGQRDAVRLGLARALYKMDPELKPALRRAGLITRDSRQVERKKYNHKKARKKPQYSKR